MRLIVDNVSSLPIGNLQDLGAMCRRLGDQFDEGAFGTVLSVVSVIVTESGVSLHCFGENPSGYELMGIFEAAKLQVFADGIVDE